MTWRTPANSVTKLQSSLSLRGGSFTLHQQLSHSKFSASPPSRCPPPLHPKLSRTRRNLTPRKTSRRRSIVTSHLSYIAQIYGESGNLQSDNCPVRAAQSWRVCWS